MKFEQLLKIICKRYFLLFFFIIPPLPSTNPRPFCLFVSGEGSDGTGHSVNRHTELLWCWLCFQNIFWGLIPIAGSWVFILFCFHIVPLETFMMASEVLWNMGEKRGLQLELGFSKKRNLCQVRCSNVTWQCLLKGIPVPRWESVVRVIWRANIVNQPL